MRNKMKCKFQKRTLCNNGCRYWINFEEDENCSLVSIEKNGAMPLREVAKRLNISYVRVKQIEDRLVEKIKQSF